jgi:hypothetical protein
VDESGPSSPGIMFRARRRPVSCSSPEHSPDERSGRNLAPNRRGRANQAHADVRVGSSLFASRSAIARRAAGRIRRLHACRENLDEHSRHDAPGHTWHGASAGRGPLRARRRRGPERAGSDARERGAQESTPPRYALARSERRGRGVVGQGGGEDRSERARTPVNEDRSGQRGLARSCRAVSRYRGVLR